jgi:glycerol-3-phosphate acyltransferase PlsY
MKIILLAITAFVLGSIPFGVIIARSQGIDLRKTGSRNIGATNVLRSIGKLPAVLTLLGDILKGTAAVAIARYIGIDPGLEGVVGIAAILGHNFSLFLGFRGGKGVATSLGVLIVYAPQIALITIIIWLMTVLLTRYSSLGALVSFTLLPVNVFFFDKPDKLPFAIIITALIIVRHIDNIRRLLQGTEQRSGERK